MAATRPDLDPELISLLDQMPALPGLSLAVLDQIRPFARIPVEPFLAGRAIQRRELAITAPDGVEIPVSVFSPHPPTGSAPCIYWLHGGGMIMGDRFSQIDIPLEWLERFGAVVVSVDYRLAPEATGATLVEDGYAGLLWVVEHAAELGIDPTRLIIAGTSAGGGLAAGVTLMARDSGGPELAASVLVCPMLDHRNGTTSSRQFSGPAVWSREMNEFGWGCLLGDQADAAVSSYVSPALAEDLADLPTTYVDAGSAEVFRDEAVEYVTRIWAAGGQAELHIWAGGCHGFDALFPGTVLAQSARQTRTAWLARVLDAIG